MIPQSREENIVVQQSGDETLVYDLDINKAYLLNSTAAFVWQSLDGKTDIPTVARKLSDKTKQPVNEEIVWLAVGELKKDNLLRKSEEIRSPLEGMNRREAVRRVGLATMIALPLVSSLVAPTAAHAVSGFNCTGSACASNVPTTCQTGGSYALGCFNTGPACTAAAQASAGGFNGAPPNHCCKGWGGNTYEFATGCCNVTCLS